MKSIIEVTPQNVGVLSNVIMALEIVIFISVILLFFIGVLKIITSSTHNKNEKMENVDRTFTALIAILSAIVLAAVLFAGYFSNIINEGSSKFPNQTVMIVMLGVALIVTTISAIKEIVKRISQKQKAIKEEKWKQK